MMAYPTAGAWPWASSFDGSGSIVVTYHSGGFASQSFTIRRPIFDPVLGAIREFDAAMKRAKWQLGHPPLWRLPRRTPVPSFRSAIVAGRRCSPRSRETPGIDPTKDNHEVNGAMM